MSESKPIENDDSQAPIMEASAPDGPAVALDARTQPAEATLAGPQGPPEATLDVRKRPPEARLDTRGVRRRPAVKKRAVRAPATSYTVEAAADLLSLDPTALRARLRRAQRAEGGTIVADLGGGISGFKLGKSWRLRFPER
jgi:hypothetical protein